MLCCGLDVQNADAGSVRDMKVRILIACFGVAVLHVGTAAPQVLIDGGDAAESGAADTSAPTGEIENWDDDAWDAAAGGGQRACPDFMLQVGERLGPLDACGTGRPAPGSAHFLDGIWEIKSPGNGKIASLTIFTNFSYGVLHRSDPNQPSPTVGAWRLEGDTGFRRDTFAFRPNLADDGGVTAAEGQFEFCNCVKMRWEVHQTGDADILVGTWRYDEQTGPSIWRRRSAAPTIRSVTIGEAAFDAAGEAVNDSYGFGQRAGRITRAEPVTCARQNRRNCDDIWVSLFGDNFGGAHTIWIDPASHIELDGEAGWYCRDGAFVGYWNRCGMGASEPDGNVAGIGVKLRLWDGLTSGRYNLWVAGTPVPIEVEIGGMPAPEAPALVLLDARDPEGTQITEVREGEPFIVSAHYDGPHPDTWVALEMPALRPVAGAADRTMVLQRTEDPKVFESGWLAVERGEPVPE